MNATGTSYPVLPAADIAPGEMHAAIAGAMQVVVYNLDSELYATANICSHAYALLSDGCLK